jgi:hypothetical protein
MIWLLQRVRIQRRIDFLIYFLCRFWGYMSSLSCHVLDSIGSSLLFEFLVAARIEEIIMPFLRHSLVVSVSSLPVLSPAIAFSGIWVQSYV